MFIFVLKFRIDTRGIRSLKEKRRIRLRLTDRFQKHLKLRLKEVEEQDSLKGLVLAMSEVLLSEKEGAQKKETYYDKIAEWCNYPIWSFEVDIVPYSLYIKNFI